MKLLLDSNVIISALSARGLCNAIFELCIEKHELVISNSIISEITDILKNKFKAPESTLIDFKKYINEFFIIVADKNDIDVCRDKNDNKILSVAVDNNVLYIITGDNDLLILKEIKGIKIINPRTFWEISRKDKLF
jgi:uncharacterized protein